MFHPFATLAVSKRALKSPYSYNYNIWKLLKTI